MSLLDDVGDFMGYSVPVEDQNDSGDITQDYRKKLLAQGFTEEEIDAILSGKKKPVPEYTLTQTPEGYPYEIPTGRNLLQDVEAPPQQAQGLLEAVPDETLPSEEAQAGLAREAAALRTRRAVLPEGGREEGKLTNVPKNLLVDLPLAIGKDLVTFPSKVGGAVEQYEDTGEYNPQPFMQAASMNPATPLIGSLLGGAISAALPGAEAAQKLTPAQELERLGQAKPKKAPKPNQVLQERLPAAVEEASKYYTEPTRDRTGEYGTAAGIVAASIGAIFAPMLYKVFKTGAVPKFRPVADAAPGTMAISRNTDYARTADDATKGILNVLKRSGADPQAVEAVEKIFGSQTRSNANNLVNSAIATGQINAPSFVFKTKIPLVKLAERDSPEVRQYLFLRDTADKLLVANTRHAKLNAAKQASAGPPTVRNMQLPDVLQQIGALERTNPEVKQVAAAWNDLIKSIRSFEARGEHATISKKQLQRLNQEAKNFVPYVSHTDPLQQNPFAQLADYMHVRLRKRMENEAKAMYKGALIQGGRTHGKSLMTPVTEKQLKNNPHWRKNVVTTYRRGKAEHHTTDPFVADWLKLDPYFPSTWGNIAYGTRRIFERATTGDLAPWFSVTSALRSWQQAKMTIAEGLKSPTAVGSLLAIPQQLYPQMAKQISKMLDDGSMGWLNKTLGPANTQALSLRLAKAYDNSLFAQLKTAGTHQGSQFMQNYNQSRSHLMRLIDGHDVPNWYKGYINILDAVHNAPAFNMVKRNIKQKPVSELAVSARNMTGDPRTGGQFFTPSGKAARIEGTNRVGRGMVKGYAAVTEAMRQSIPWANVIQQSIKRTGQAYLENPAKFVGRAWLYSAMPGAAFYFGARAAGTDPNGVSYADYMVNGRSDTDRILNWYIPIPGKPAEQGIRIPRFQELAVIPYMMETALDHLSRSAIFTEEEDFKRAFSAYADITIVPPMPPIGNVLLASQGMGGLYGMFGQTYTPKADPFNDMSGLPHSLDLTARAVAPGIATVVGSGATAFMSSDEQNFLQALGNAAKASGREMVKKTPIVRDIAGIEQYAPGNTRITDELFTKRRFLDRFVKYYKSGDEVKVKPKSVQGGEIATSLLGPVSTSEPAGITPKAPTNPLYNLFAQELYNKIVHDTPLTQRGDPNGGIGFNSVMNRYGDATNHLKTLRKVNDGNFVTWQRLLAGRPEQLKELKDNNIDSKNLAAVRNYYENKRRDASKLLLNAIRNVEKEFSDRLGVPIKVEDLDPYGKGVPEAKIELQTREY